MQSFIESARQYDGFQEVVFIGIMFLSILFLRFVLIYIFRKRTKGSVSQRKQIRYTVDWIVFYTIIIFIILYYGETDWMTRPLLTIGEIEITILLLIISFFIISFAHHLSKFTTQLFMPKIYERYQLDTGVQFTFNRVFHYIIMVIAIIVSISTVGIDLSAFTVFASVLGVGIGFGLQGLTANFVAGIILLFERPIKVGDRIIVDQIIGDVEQINMRATVIRSVNNEHIIVPNSYFLEEHVVNRSYQDPMMRLITPIGVSYGSDPELVRRLLLQVAHDEAAATDTVLLDPEPVVHFVAFGDSSLDFELFLWVSEARDLIKVKTNLNFRIYHILKEHQIEIPFPQRDLHLRSVDPTIYSQFEVKKK